METTLTTPAGVDMNGQLGFTAHTVVIDNITNAWATVPATGRQIAPWQHSVVVALPGTQQALIKWSPPAGILVAPYDKAQQLIATYTTDQLPSSLGQPTQQPGNAGVLLGTFTAARGASTSSQLFSIPQGVDALFVMIDAVAGMPAGTTVAVLDPTLTRTYGNFGPIVEGSVGTGWLLFPVEPSIDPQVIVDVTMTVGAGGPFTFRVLAITHPALTLATIIGNETPLTVVGAGATAAGLPVNTGGQGAGTWLESTSAVNAGNTITLAGVANSFWHVMAVGVSFSGGPTGAITLDITDGTNDWKSVYNVGTNPKVTNTETFPDGGLRSVVGGTVTITLPAAGGGIASFLSVAADLRTF